MSEWERREGEPTRWFARFEAYRRAGPNRSLLGTYKAEAGGKGRNAKTPQSWDKAAAEWEWKARAEAWDMAEAARIDAQEQEARDRERNENRKARRTLALGLFNKAALALQKIGGDKDDEIANLSQVANTVKIVLGELRAEFDDLPTQRNEDTGELTVRIIRERRN